MLACAIGDCNIDVFKDNKNQNWDPLRAVDTLMRKGMGHTAVSTTKSLVSDPLDLAAWSLNSLNLNSLLVTRQMTLFHQGVRMGEKLVP